MQGIQLNIIGQSIQLVKRSADEMRGLNMEEKPSLDFYNGNFRDTDLLFAKPKGATPTPLSPSASALSTYLVTSVFVMSTVKN